MFQSVRVSYVRFPIIIFIVLGAKRSDKILTNAEGFGVHDADCDDQKVKGAIS